MPNINTMRPVLSGHLPDMPQPQTFFPIFTVNEPVFSGHRNGAVLSGHFKILQWIFVFL